MENLLRPNVLCTCQDGFPVPENAGRPNYKVGHVAGTSRTIKTVFKSKMEKALGAGRNKRNVVEMCITGYGIPLILFYMSKAQDRKVHSRMLK